MVEILQQIRGLSDAQNVEIPTTSEIMVYNSARINSGPGDRPYDPYPSSPEHLFDTAAHIVDSSSAGSMSPYSFPRRQGHAPWKPRQQPRSHIVDLGSAGSMSPYSFPRRQNYTSWNRIEQIHPHSVDSSSAGSMSSHTTASTLPTVISFDEYAEADGSITSQTINKRQPHVDYICNVSGCSTRRPMFDTRTRSVSTQGFSTLEDLRRHMRNAHPDGSSAGPQ
ncbi:hypothetical protein CGRA01v4_02717 [Colletotrichum graminicola]|uniref:Uncharacterized protein n=1 Tax=Colletotrichum graminicola (strain M1.001 / M2 / FGSC 10212) TaxID=645133 RepID=E3QAF9_COLGM|nr:uncharacterized protein GLRG_02991 [Colletotrichum graminicola M1.001]EFQ27847.1 hypothetical protein GLRG_02991 [Colletotrichum graminicola M1.001]WDK11438.1 hypothetical protein CGRA01v4_02717 [Colletotrichum graminicola]